MDLLKQLQKVFGFLKKHKKIILIILISLFVILMFFEQVKKIIFILIFIALSSVSKLYHKIFKSTIIIDVVLFTTLLVSLVYKNIFLGFVVGIPSLLLADYFGAKLSHYSLVSLIGLGIVILLSQFIGFLPLTISLIILTIIYELYACFLYYLLGSSPTQIIMFVVSHFISNMIMIFSFATYLSQIMV